MSLINRMLQDLDARQSEGGLAANLPNDVRPLPVVRPSRRPVILGVLAATVVLGLLVAYQVRENSPVPEAVPLAQAPTPVETPPSTVVTEPAAQRMASPAAEAVPSPVVAETPSPLQSLESSSLRLAESLRVPEGNKAITKPASPVPVTAPTALPQKPLSPLKQATAETMAEKKTALAEPSATPSIRSAKTPLIERTEVTASPRERADAEYRKAIAAVNLGRINEAVDGLHNALRQDVQHIGARQLLVKLLLEARRIDEAMQSLQEGLQVLPAQTGWAMSLARLRIERGDLAGAWQVLDHSLPAAGGSADYQGFAGHVLHRLGRDREAAERYQMATRLAPGDGRWWLGLGLVYDAEGRVTEAREALQRAKASGTLSPELMAVTEQKLR